MRGYYVFFIILFCTGCASLPFQSSHMSAEEVSQLTFVKQPVEDTFAYQIYRNQFKNEMAKVNYLINLVSYSSQVFSRNGRRVNGYNSGQWLRYKVNKYYNEIKTVEDFIEKIGSYSRASKREYCILTPGNRQCPIKHVYYNELKRLNAYEMKRTQKAMDASLGEINKITDKSSLLPSVAVSQSPLAQSGEGNVSLQ
ncbi:MAG: DUF5329 domain-containing protein [Candidatus Omnitrophica bacterium]|nr:DUF5329 domain-containing protein [Candidatus Omnitrophota bacterium]